LRKVKDAVDKARGDSDFPTDLPAEPNVFEMNFSELMPVMNLNLSGDYPLAPLHQDATHREDRLDQSQQHGPAERTNCALKRAAIRARRGAVCAHLR
jgi:hypothetical protein